MQTIETCKRCGRPLKDAKSIKRGYGPKCYKKAVEGIQADIEEYYNGQDWSVKSE